MKKSLIQRFEEKFLPEPNTGCWLWKSSFTGRGYGIIRVDGKYVGAHRVSYELYKGPIPEGLFVCHKCDTPACVNPDHLFIGTPTDNVQDMLKKGRELYTPSLGTDNGTAKLDDDQIREIRSLYATGEFILSDLAIKFGVHTSLISLITNRKIWKHVA